MLINLKFLHKKVPRFVGKHFCTSSKKNASKDFFDITLYCKQACKLRKAKTLF